MRTDAGMFIALYKFECYNIWYRFQDLNLRNFLLQYLKMDEYGSVEETWKGSHMDNSEQKAGIKWVGICPHFMVCLVLLGGGYWLYKRSIERAVYETTASFMEQIADHDRLNVVNPTEQPLGSICTPVQSRFMRDQGTFRWRGCCMI